MGKRGQFYIIAAVVIIAIILGLATVANKAIVQPKHAEFFDLSEDYEAETSKVIDYGVYNKYSPAVNIDEKVRNISETFANSAFAKDPNVHLVFIYGNRDHWNKTDIPPIVSSISYSLGSEEQIVTNIISQKINTTAGSGGEANVTIAGSNYQFNLTKDENFYFIIQTTSPSGEKNVAIRG